MDLNHLHEGLARYFRRHLDLAGTEVSRRRPRRLWGQPYEGGMSVNRLFIWREYFCLIISCPRRLYLVTPSSYCPARGSLVKRGRNHHLAIPGSNQVSRVWLSPPVSIPSTDGRIRPRNEADHFVGAYP